MNRMFYNCMSLTSINLSNFNTSNVDDMDKMLYACRSLSYIDISSFSTSLEEIDLSNFESQTGVLKISEDFLEKLKVRPSGTWAIDII